MDRRFLYDKALRHESVKQKQLVIHIHIQMLFVFDIEKNV